MILNLGSFPMGRIADDPIFNRNIFLPSKGIESVENLLFDF